ncbi:gamma-glutamyl-gamma-aminobutyrate hydrolase family protein [Marinitenerispora sediminis]|uniref:Gamma-glutamyl-gamma-aminobutyrate hydrolase n=1 Tax=Marinitenerispora sediminis TaxID=1931232 RepID=A0A368T7Y0_9ACTN|nr:gamma-glutamyl-gamma-aminobutyrate hydrolase family protein [Marinitenerispora sediminis]RCV51766.1 gamma-glutamyl-gamma-aminobutyrate hydrolase [Marinitenerispora sediminis]RCV57643.1 gamma-glutamyl-gamma-aminobutyrate hydrolase [Marinitenerispora sediminis]RCV59938.1 gamma-glutamyl-gamma-aminobutyrate hydrolase [Marinitenerispora sediminis]
MPRPLIGITSYLEPARWGSWVREAAVVATPYLREVHRAGGLPVAVPPTHPRWVPDLAGGFDGFLLADGAHVDPALYGARPHPRTEDPDARRDAFEISLAQIAVDEGIPVLGIGRGAHVLNVATGGTLVQYLPETTGHDGHAADPVKLSSADVSVSVTSVLGQALGDRATVLESHTQGFNRLGERIVPVAWAEDHSVEAVEVAGHPFAVGVQWHPEEGDDRRVFKALVAAAARRRGGDG